MKRREAAVPAGPPLPAWVTSFVFADWVDLSEAPPADIRALAAANSESFAVEVGFWRRARALGRWRAAAERWCAEHNASFAVTVLGWPAPSPAEVAAGLLPQTGPGRAAGGLPGLGRPTQSPPLSASPRGAPKNDR